MRNLLGWPRLGWLKIAQIKSYQNSPMCPFPNCPVGGKGQGKNRFLLVCV